MCFFDLYVMFDMSMPEKLLDSLPFILQQLHARHVSTPIGHAGSMEPHSPAVAQCATDGSHAALPTAAAAAAADFSAAPAADAGQMHI